MAQELAESAEPQPRRRGGEFLALAAGAGDQQAHTTLAGTQRGKRFEEQVKPLLWLQAAHGADGKLPRANAEPGAGFGHAAAVAAKRAVVDPVGNRANPSHTNAGAEQLRTDLPRYG